MKKYRKLITLLLLSFGVATTQAQQVAATAGGNASGMGGTVNYSIGQIISTTEYGSNGSVSQGVQQPYEISEVSGIEDRQITLDMQVYPNPTSDYLLLNIESDKLKDLSYQLFDINGGIIEVNKIVNTSETINMKNLSNGTYFLKVTNNNKEVKTFKIIKY